MGHWLFQSQQEVGEGAAGSPSGLRPMADPLFMVHRGLVANTDTRPA